MGTFPQRGEVYYVQLPQEDNPRPAVIVSVDSRNRAANDVIVVPLSRSARGIPTHIAIGAGKDGIRQSSLAKCEQITAIPKDWIVSGPLGGTVDASTLYSIERAIQRAVGIHVE